ncbi:methyltransferase family protein [Novosphingobium terrae]|uniref:methyltransferase family protein n=1 Tax=Novosphingobium terrae TaxID=2726189 RepID=UPI001980857D|nr:isoprenylcysteine carboxylmethyltransferase family protein [Novosphingobium terrae]
MKNINPLQGPRLGKVLDRAEQVVILLLWVALLERVIRSANPYAPLLLLSETAVLIFALIRRPTEAITRKPGDWLLAITATAAPLMVLPGHTLFPQIVGLGVMLVLLGNVGQAAAKLALRRSFGIAPANRGVKVSGPYALVRHPMYAGYLLVHIGNLMLFFSWLNVAIYAVGWSAQILRLQAEEKLLSQDDAYRAYCEKVRWRLIPGIF